jgi:oligopeptide/dipeptide ABC transporter, ATP-binding protein, C-terminal domain
MSMSASVAPGGPDAAPALLKAEGITKTFLIPRGLFRPALRLSAVNDVSLEVRAGRTLGIVGESGCGKSTLSRILAGTLRATSGRLVLDGQDLDALSPATRKQALRKVQMVFQSPYSSLNPRMTIAQIVREPLDIHARSVPLAQRDARARAMLERVGLGAAFADRHPNSLSGGQLQRVGIARALIGDARLIICDEPVSALDVSIQAQVLNLLHEMQRSLGLSYVFISHDLSVVANMADDIAVMYLGKVMEYGPASTVLGKPAHPYTQALVDSANIPDPRIEKSRRTIALKGEIPTPTQPPSGCRFRTRCRLAAAVCAEQEPALAARGAVQHAVACHFA